MIERVNRTERTAPLFMIDPVRHDLRAPVSSPAVEDGMRPMLMRMRSLAQLSADATTEVAVREHLDAAFTMLKSSLADQAGRPGAGEQNRRAASGLEAHDIATEARATAALAAIESSLRGVAAHLVDLRI